jgi:hypothetical protein
VLQLEGTCSDPAATLRAEFGGRTESLANNAGVFRADFAGVAVYPPTVTVVSDSGTSVSASVYMH